jgi:hypothetical protein
MDKIGLYIQLWSEGSFNGSTEFIVPIVLRLETYGVHLGGSRGPAPPALKISTTRIALIKMRREGAK